MERQMQGEALERMDVYNPEAMRNVAVNYHPTGKTSKRHTHDFYEINYLLRGEAVNEVSGHSFAMKQGDALLLHPEAFHTVWAGEGALLLNVLIRPAFLAAHLSSAEGGALALFAENAAREDFTEYLFFRGAKAEEEVFRLIRAAKCGERRLATEGTLLSLLAALSESAEEITPSRRHDSGYRRFVAILSYLYEHATHTNVAAISERFGYSPAHLSRLFRRYVGETPAALLCKVRLARAASLLAEGDLAVCRIAEECGFSCVPYFHRAFKSAYGATPQDYRQTRRGTE